LLSLKCFDLPIHLTFNNNHISQYTEEEFFSFYGGTTQWENARKVPDKPKATKPAMSPAKQAIKPAVVHAKQATKASSAEVLSASATTLKPATMVVTSVALAAVSPRALSPTDTALKLEHYSHHHQHHHRRRRHNHYQDHHHYHHHYHHKTTTTSTITTSTITTTQSTIEPPPPTTTFTTGVQPNLARPFLLRPTLANLFSAGWTEVLNGCVHPPPQ
jgi:hypothetical protein